MPKITKIKKCAAVIAAVAIVEDEENKENKKRIWTRNWLLRRKRLGCFENLQQELALEDEHEYRRWIRMSTSDFEYLVERVTPYIEKKDTVMREAIAAAERLSLTLRFLATGESQSSLKFLFRIAQNTISSILPAVCEALYEVLREDFLKIPKNKQEWMAISDEFERRWNFPMCIGALDGKHVKICPPPGSGSNYYNYKGDFSIVLLALVNANTEFIYIDVGTNGRISDGGVWNKCKLKAALESGMLNIPKCGALPNNNVLVPYVIVADDAFPLCNYMIKPFAGQNLTEEKMIYNYRLSRARRVVENAFGILACRFRLYRSAIIGSTKNIEKMVLATCALHNFLKRRSGNGYPGNENFTEVSTSSSGFVNLELNRINPCNVGKEIQKRFCNYFNSVGAVAWQKDYVNYH